MSKPIIIIDTREKTPYNFRVNENLGGIEIIKLDSGDYSLKGMEDLITIERKNNVIELCNNLGKNRKRFEAELERMKDIKFKFIIVEDYWSSLLTKKPFKYVNGKPIYMRMNPNAVFQSIIAIQLKYGVNVIMAGTREMAQKIVRSLLIKAFNYRKLGKI